jgi:hypothetical protein
VPRPVEHGPLPQPFDPAHPEVGGVRFAVPDPFVFRPTRTPMRAAEYVIVGEHGEGEAVLVIHHFPGMGGSADANARRWIGQFRQPDGKPSSDVAHVENARVGGFEIERVDVSGIYTAMRLPHGPEQPSPQENQRLLGAIVMGPDGPVFFKLVGPVALMKSAEPTFERLVQSFAPAS